MNPFAADRKAACGGSNEKDFQTLVRRLEVSDLFDSTKLLLAMGADDSVQFNRPQRSGLKFFSLSLLPDFNVFVWRSPPISVAACAVPIFHDQHRQ